MKSQIEKKFVKIYDTNSDAIFRYCYYRVFDREKAKELMQESFMKVWRYLSEGNDIQNIRAFVYKTATNLIIDYSRKKKEHSLDQMREQGFEPSHDEKRGLEARIDLQKVLGVVEKLDEKYRDVLLLRYVEGFYPKEIAKILEESENVVSVRLNRAKKQLKELMANN